MAANHILFKGETPIHKWLSEAMPNVNLSLIGKIKPMIQNQAMFIQVGRSRESRIVNWSLFELLLFHVGGTKPNRDITLVSFLSHDFCAYQHEFFGCFPFIQLGSFKRSPPKQDITNALISNLYHSNTIQRIFFHEEVNGNDYTHIKHNILNNLKQ